MSSWHSSHEILGVSVAFSMLQNVDWDFLDARLIKKLDAWIGNSTSSSGRTIPINGSLSGIPSFYAYVPIEQNRYQNG